MRQLRTASRRAQRPRVIGSNSRAAGTVLRCLKIGRIGTKLPTSKRYERLLWAASDNSQGRRLFPVLGGQMGVLLQSQNNSIIKKDMVYFS